MRKERPILFSTDMVQAILEGHKTMTRRKIKAKIDDCYFQSLVLHSYGLFTWAPNGNYSPKEEDIIEVKCPFGKRGDILWVRECFKIIPPNMIFYKSDKENKSTCNWKPSIFMPKAAARIWLEITDIKAERMYPISREDAIAEGCGNEGTDYPEGNFYAVWRKINGIESYESNPWLWVISFKVLSATGRPHEKLGPF